MKRSVVILLLIAVSLVIVAGNYFGFVGESNIQLAPKEVQVQCGASVTVSVGAAGVKSSASPLYICDDFGLKNGNRCRDRCATLTQEEIMVALQPTCRTAELQCQRAVNNFLNNGIVNGDGMGLGTERPSCSLSRNECRESEGTGCNPERSVSSDCGSCYVNYGVGESRTLRVVYQDPPGSNNAGCYLAKTAILSSAAQVTLHCTSCITPIEEKEISGGIGA